MRQLKKFGFNPRFKVAKVTQTEVNENTEKEKSEENDKNKVDEQKDNKSQSEENKDNAIFQQKLKELVKKEEDKEKLKKEIIDNLELVVMAPFACVFTIVGYIGEMFGRVGIILCNVGNLIIIYLLRN